ncbi:unnamed protein product [Ectocarpus sp. 12 AP-2014]
MLLGPLSHGARLSLMEQREPFSQTPTPLPPPPPEPVPLESKAIPSYNRDLNPFAGEESNNNAPIEDPVFLPTLQAGMHSPFSAFLTKLYLVMTFGHARAPPSPPPVKEISRSR